MTFVIRGLSTDSTGGTITTVNDYTLHSFYYTTATKTWTMVAASGGSPKKQIRRANFGSVIE